MREVCVADVQGSCQNAKSPAGSGVRSFSEASFSYSPLRATEPETWPGHRTALRIVSGALLCPARGRLEHSVTRGFPTCSKKAVRSLPWRCAAASISSEFAKQQSNTQWLGILTIDGLHACDSRGERIKKSTILQMILRSTSGL